MKLSKKFFEDLHKIGQDAFIEKNQWIGKLVPDIIIDNLKKRGINQEDIEGCICLTVEEAKRVVEAYKILSNVYKAMYVPEGADFCKESVETLEERIEQAEKCDGKS